MRGHLYAAVCKVFVFSPEIDYGRACDAKIIYYGKSMFRRIFSFSRFHQHTHFHQIPTLT